MGEYLGNTFIPNVGNYYVEKIMDHVDIELEWTPIIVPRVDAAHKIPVYVT